MYFYFFGAFEADLLGGTGGLSRYNAIKSTKGTDITIASTNTSCFMSSAEGSFYKISPGAAAPNVIDT